MKLEELKICKDERSCNECLKYGKDNDIKELYLGRMSIALCKECRDKLLDILKNK